jgi:phage tail-like protein
MPDRTTPYGAFNFVVKIDGVNNNRADEPLGGFSDVSGLTTEITIAEYRYGNDPENHVRTLPGPAKQTGGVSLKRGVVNSKDLWDWINQVRVTGPAAKRDVIITLRDEAGKDVQSWTLRGTVPIKYTAPTFAAKGGGDVAMEELVLSAESLVLGPD